MKLIRIGSPGEEKPAVLLENRYYGDISNPVVDNNEKI